MSGIFRELGCALGNNSMVVPGKPLRCTSIRQLHLQNGILAVKHYDNRYFMALRRGVAGTDVCGQRLNGV